jgi:methyltransferase family protein
MPNVVQWLDERTADVCGVRFLVSDDENEYRDELSNADRFVMVKDVGCVKRCVERFAELKPQNLLEIGIYQGGSTVFWNLVLEPERHLALDLYDRSVEVLDEFAASGSKHGRLDIRYGLDQSDAEAVTAAVQETFGDEDIDLVIDDGSHSYAESRASFETLFPRLGPGGTYVIEDWDWAHRPLTGVLRTQLGHERPALTNLIVELMLVCGSRSGVVDALIVEPRAAHVIRGEKPLESPFRLADQYSNRGMPYRPLL